MALLAIMVIGYFVLPVYNPPIGSGSASSAAVVRAEPTGPTEMAIIAPAVHLDAPLDPIRFKGSTLEPPEDVSRAGWWADGAELSADGRNPTVITGHVSDGRDNPGAFKALWDLKPGMIATTRDEQGVEREWRVAATQRFDKDELPRSLFLSGEHRTLRLITCTSRVENGGRFHYDENLVVELEPLAK